MPSAISGAVKRKGRLVNSTLRVSKTNRVSDAGNIKDAREQSVTKTYEHASKEFQTASKDSRSAVSFAGA